jgi:hypothetical protein
VLSRIPSCPPSGVFPPEAYLTPLERDRGCLTAYANALADPFNPLLPENSPYLFQIAVHHVAFAVFRPRRLGSARFRHVDSLLRRVVQSAPMATVKALATHLTPRPQDKVPCLQPTNHREALLQHDWTAQADKARNSSAQIFSAAAHSQAASSATPLACRSVGRDGTYQWWGKAGGGEAKRGGNEDSKRREDNGIRAVMVDAAGLHDDVRETLRAVLARGDQKAIATVKACFRGIS